MKQVEIYTDGACSGNPGKGGFAAVLVYNGAQKAVSGGELCTTNNRMELLGVINGLRALKEPCIVTVFSDSAYIVNAFNLGWIDKWTHNGWRTEKTEVKNRDLWLELLNLTSQHNVRFQKVKGHSGIELNELCDKLAREEIAKLP